MARRGLADAGLSPAEVDAFVSRLEGERGVASERLYRTFFFRELPGIVRGLNSPVALRTPTRLVFGQRDPILTTRAIEDVTGQSDRIELELVADATHFVVDEQPELIADRVLRLLASPVTWLNGFFRRVRQHRRSRSRVRAYVSLGDSYAVGLLIPLQAPLFGCLKSNNNYANLTARNLGAHAEGRRAAPAPRPRT